jgi:phage terminase small subunit
MIPTGRTPGRPKAVSTEPTEDYTEDGVPEAPRELKARGKKEWNRIWKAGTWLHREQHYFLVLNYCQKVEELTEYQTELNFLKKKNKDIEGAAISVYKQMNGSYAPFPQVRLIQESRAQLTAWLIEMKLSPSNLPADTDADDELKSLTERDTDGTF